MSSCRPCPDFCGFCESISASSTLHLDLSFVLPWFLVSRVFLFEIKTNNLGVPGASRFGLAAEGMIWRNRLIWQGDELCQSLHGTKKYLNSKGDDKTIRKYCICEDLLLQQQNMLEGY